MQMSRLGSLLGAAALALGAMQAQAAIVTLKYSGTASGYDDLFGGGYLDAPFLLSFTFDETADPAGQGALLAASLTINGGTWNVPVADFYARDVLHPGGFRDTGLERAGFISLPEPGTELTILEVNLRSTGIPALRNTPGEFDGVNLVGEPRRNGYYTSQHYFTRPFTPDLLAYGTFNTTHLSVTSEGPDGSTACCLVNGPTQIPEPATWAMLILGFGAVGAVSRRRQCAGSTRA